MNSIYQSPLISFIDTTTQTPIAHPDGDYSELNVWLKRLDGLIQKHQPHQAVIFSCTIPSEKTKKDVDLSGNVSHASLPMSFSDPVYSFTVPKIGNQQEQISFRTMSDFNDFNTHRVILKDLLKTAITSAETEYDDHPLHHNKQVVFRTAEYIDNREAFSLWPTHKPFGEYPLTKPLFDNAIGQLDSRKENYRIYIDFVKDWGEEPSSLGGPPKSYGVELSVFIGNKNFPLIHMECDATTLHECTENHDYLDETLSVLFLHLSENLPNFYQNLNKPSQRLKF